MPLVVLNMARAPGRLLPGDARRRPRRLPHTGARPDGRPRGGRARRSWRSTSPTSGATRCWSSATTTSPTRTQSVDVAPLDFGPLPAEGLGARRLHRRHRPRQARLAARRRQAARRRRLRPGRHYTRAPATGCDDGRRHRAAGRDRVRRRRRGRRRRVRHPGPVRPLRRRASCAPTACRVGFVRPITLFPFPTRGDRRRRRAAPRARRVYENNQGQMVDDVRLAVLGRCPVEFIGGLSLDAPASASLPTSTSTACSGAHPQDALRPTTTSEVA